ILRKHIEGGKILGLTQLGLERIVTLSIQNYNEFGDLATLQLTLEIMGKHSNLLLVDPKTGIILDGMRRYSHALSRHREVLPGRPYLLPPSQGKVEEVSGEDAFRQILYTEDLEHKLTDILLARFNGIGPELALEIVVTSSLDGKTRLSDCGEIDLVRLYQAYARLGQQRGANPDPRLYFRLDDGRTPAAFTFVPFQQYEGLPMTTLSSVNEVIARFFESKASHNTLEAKRGSLLKVVQEFRAHLARKLTIYEETLATARESFKYQRFGELITANLYRISPGMEVVEVENYHEPELPLVRIPLDPRLNAIDNAQRFYKLYNKAKAALQKTEPLRQAGLTELEYLDSLMVSLKQASSLEELEEVHTELVEQGYLAGRKEDKKNRPVGKQGGKSRGKSSSKQGDKPGKFPIKLRVFQSSQGQPILVGKNNKQNDYLTLKRGKPGDLWLHVKNIPGSHVLVPLADDEEFPDDVTLEEAAALAIHFSQARGSSQVPVDYTHVRQLKKPNGAKPGMVIYEQNWTLYLTPKPEVLETLLSTEA
ncbi:MAG: NFACT RNA binding domain-containing protein, partial [Desulfitobacteriaceae bacterium]|nr:NFACT RNA binding domain-containing protein [Desulfitobacteriaceae bacterium]MDI6880413.1 NFACT RNA binding domain-containing protein [Desulfitobacteriaceae bacterium]